MKRAIRTTLAAFLATAAATIGMATATPAQAAGSVHLIEIYYNSPGSDTGSNTSLNAEWVKIGNSTSQTANLTGWTLTDAQGHRYTFGTFYLYAGKSVYVHTGYGTNNSSNRYQNHSWYVWNNDRDTATLRKSSGTWVDSCGYNNSGRSYTYC